jgi:tetratricopeptide (TPR) repeat protein
MLTETMIASDRRWPRRLAWWGMLLALIVAAGPAFAQIREGKALLQAGRLDEAMAAYERASAEGIAEGRAGVGLVWLRRRQWDKALEAFQTSQKMDPNLALSYYGQGEVARRRNQCEEAVPLFRRATELDRKFPEAQLALGQCLVTLKKHPEAVAALNEGLKWGPKWRPKFLVALGDAELARDSLRDAGIYYTKAREESPEDPTPRRALGDFYVKRGIPALAVPEYMAAASMDTSDVELVYALGQAFFFDKRYNDALEQYRRAVTMDPEFPPAQFSLGYIYYLSGPADRRRYADAKEPLEKFVALEPNDARGWSVLGRTLYFLRERDASYDALRKAESLGEKSKDHFTVFARLLTERREYDAALQAYTRGEPEPSDFLVIAQLYSRQGQYAAAESVYNEVAVRDSTSRGGKMALGEIGKLRFRQRDFEGALHVFERLIALDPQNGEAYYYAGLSHKELGRFPEALTALQQAATLEPGKAERQFWLGIILAQQDSLSGAREAFTQAVALDSTGKTPSTGIALRQLGFYNLLERQYGEAIQQLERSVEINPKDVQSLVWLAQGLQNSGNRARALEFYRKALELDPGNADAKKGVETLTGGGAARQGGSQ